MEVKTYWTRTLVPDFVSRSAFQPGNLAAILSIMGWAWALVSLWGERGTPRYLHEKSDVWQGSCVCNKSLCSSEQCMGTTVLFCTFVLRPEASPNRCRMSKMALISLADGWRKMTTSSAYRPCFDHFAFYFFGFLDENIRHLSIKCRLITKLITDLICKLRDESNEPK